jgi:hypothetical protein
MNYTHKIDFINLISETPKAYLLSLNCRGTTRWFPKSQVVIDVDKKELRMTEYLWNQIHNNTGQVGLK